MRLGAETSVCVLREREKICMAQLYSFRLQDVTGGDTHTHTHTHTHTKRHTRIQKTAVSPSQAGRLM